MSGVLVLAEQYPGRDAYLLNGITNTKILLPRVTDETLTMFRVSPNRRWLAYFAVNSNLTNSRLIVVDSSGKQVFTKTISKFKWWGIVGWINDEYLLIEKYQSLPNISLATPLPTIMVNPFTGSEKEIPANYPNIIYLYPKVEWKDFGFSATGYDPTLSLVAYARNDGYVTLWSIRENREIVSIRGSTSFGNGPVWAHDASKFILDGQIERVSDVDTWKEELYSISRTGEITQLTYLTDRFSEVSISGYEWSPDNSKIAFWLSVQPENYPDLPDQSPWVDRLAILDTTSRKIVLYCIAGESMISSPVWSSNGKQVLVNLKDGNSYSAALVDIEHEISAWIERVVIPVGWMK
jgi:dipeptidyl aminopeptidase/acylaminoacyl peptidase